MRAESDGCRFAVVSGAVTITVATLALEGAALVLQEAPLALAGLPSWPRLASKRSGGGPHTDYGIAYVDEAPSPDQILVTAYQGRVPGTGVTTRATACGGLGISVGGLPYLGEILQLALTNLSGDTPGYFVGPPGPELPICLGCAVGVDLARPAFFFGGASRLDLPMPCSSSAVGAALAVQGLGIGSGTCLGTLRFSDTIDFTIR